MSVPLRFKKLWDRHLSFDSPQEMEYFSCQPRSGKFWGPQLNIQQAPWTISWGVKRLTTHFRPVLTIKHAPIITLSEVVHSLQNSLTASGIASVMFFRVPWLWRITRRTKTGVTERMVKTFVLYLNMISGAQTATALTVCSETSS
jgi:hypothetical protein